MRQDLLRRRDSFMPDFLDSFPFDPASARKQHRVVQIDQKRTSLRLEAEVWDALQEICVEYHITFPEFCRMVRDRLEGDDDPASLSAGVRMAVLAWYRNRLARSREGGREKI